MLQIKTKTVIFKKWYDSTDCAWEIRRRRNLTRRKVGESLGSLERRSQPDPSRNESGGSQHFAPFVSTLGFSRVSEFFRMMSRSGAGIADSHDHH